MKLHLPKMLTAALIAAATVITTSATVQAETVPGYSGKIITWNNTNTQNPGDLAGGKYRITTYDPATGFSVTSEERTGWGGGNGDGAQLISKNTTADRNTLRFAADYGQSVKAPVFTFNPLVLAGIIVDDGAEGYSISTTSNTSDTTARNIYLGNNNSTAAYSSIKENFAINKNHGAGKVFLRGTQTIDVATGKTYAITSNTGFDISGALTVQGGGTLKLDGAATLGCTIVNNNSTVTFTGAVTLTESLAGFESSGTYVDYKGDTATDGYAGALTYTLVKGGTYTLPAQVTWNGQTKDVVNGTVTIGDEVDKTTYHLNVADHTLNLANELENNNQLNKVVMATGTTLNADADFAGTVGGTGTAAVTIASGKALTGTVTGVALSGAGTYVLASGTDTLGSGVTLAQGWTGTVKLSNITTAELDLNKYGITGSVVEIDNWSRYLKNSDGYVYNPKLRLTGQGLTVADGYSNFSYVFAGGVEGTGDFKIGITTGANNQTYAFTGDVSKWTGAYVSQKDKNTTIKFSGLAEEMGAAITQTAGTINIEVGDGENTFSTTFDKAVTASKLTINNKATATFKDETSIGTLAGAGSLVVNAADHTVALRGGSIANTIDLQAGTLSLAGAYNLDAMVPTVYVAEYVRPEEGVAAGSGFHKVSGTIQVVTIGNGSTLSLAEGATFSYQEASVTVDDQTGVGTFDGVDLTTLWVNGTDPVSYNAAQEYAEKQATGTIVSTVCLNALGATITMDRADASVALVLSDTATTATVKATEDTTISSITGWSGKELVIDGTSTVTTGALMLDNNDTKLTVVEGATLDIAGDKHNLTLQHGSATIDGTVTIAHELDLSKGSTSDAVLVIGSTGDVTATDGLWLRGTRSFSILEDGRFTVKGLTFVGMGDESTISYNDDAAKDGNYSTTEAKYVITNMTIQANKDVTIGNTLVNSIVETGNHAVTLNTNATKVIVSNGGTFTKGADVTVEDITVEGSGTIAGNVEVSEIGITAGSVAAFEQGLPEDSGVTFANEDAHTPITVENIGEDTIHYDGIAQVDAKVTADNLVFNLADGPTTVDNKVVVKTVENMDYAGYKLTLTQVDTAELQSIGAYYGDVTLQNVGTTPIELKEMSLIGTTVAVYQGTDEQAALEGSVTITDSLFAGGGTLLANLTIAGNAEGTTTWTLLGNAMTLGSEFTLNTDTSLVNLDAATIAALESLTVGDSLQLINAAQGTGLTYGGTYSDLWFGQLFTRTDVMEGDYKVYANGQGFGLTKVSNVPEPTTGTLSLLALAALAARRRKH